MTCWICHWVSSLWTPWRFWECTVTQPKLYGKCCRAALQGAHRVYTLWSPSAKFSKWNGNIGSFGLFWWIILLNKCHFILPIHLLLHQTAIYFLQKVFSHRHLIGYLRKVQQIRIMCFEIKKRLYCFSARVVVKLRPISVFHQWWRQGNIIKSSNWSIDKSW